MPAAPLPDDELDRLRSLWACGILDTPPDPRFDSITRLAVRLYRTPIALISLIDRDRQWFKSAVGLRAGDQTSRDVAFCAYALLHPTEPLVVEDATLDHRFMDNPAVTHDGGIRFYAGVPLLDNDGHALGTLCIADTRPRAVDHEELEPLVELATSVMSMLDLQRATAGLEVARLKAEAADKAKSMFLAAMSHEIRTPLTAVLGMADLLANEPLPDKWRRHVGAIQTSGHHLLTVINDILDFSRLEAGRLFLETIDFAVESVLAETRAILEPQAFERGVALVFQGDDLAALIVRGDPTRLRQVLINLIGNGLKFTKQGSVTLTVSCKPAGPDQVMCRFEVHDTGIGIPQARQAGLFTPFTQADGSISRRHGGSGLGLAICRQLVTTMGGRIGLQSAPGQGSTFWFEIPFENGNVEAVRQKVHVDPDGVPPRKVLVAEDMQINRDLIQAMLTPRGHQVVFAENGADAVARASEQAFDLILMDVQMPVLDGLEATRRIRQLVGPAAAVPIFALTANVMEAERRECLDAGMSGVLAKPIAWTDLFHTLAKPGGDVPAPAFQAPAQEVRSAREEDGELLDEVRIQQLKAMAGPARAAAFLADALRSVEQLYAEVELLKHRPAEMGNPAHRLAGMAPTFGMPRLGLIGRRIENAAKEGRPVDGLVQQLGEVLDATRSALLDLQLLSHPAVMQ